ncbi:MAG: superoxide dismutase [Bacteroidetes bacterium]|nr:superoxide dismutase [Bacteroidota bacterium]
MRLFFFIGVIASHFIINGQPYNLPNLNFNYEEYEPYIDAKTMEIHHSKHHQAYVTNLNKAIAGTNLEKSSLNDLMMYASFRSEAVRNNAGGHFNHTLFWEILTPKEKQANPISSELENVIKNQFGNIDSLKAKLNQAASTRFGAGWAWLVVTPQKKLIVTSTPNQDNPIMDVAKDRGIPILGIDVWEHAYYLKYQNKRGDYLGAIWNLIDWGVVSQKYMSAINDPLLAQIEKDTWPELKEFHRVMSQVFHPSEKGNLDPLKNRSGELLAKAILLKNSTPPLPLQKEEISKALMKLVKQCDELDKLKSKNAKTEVLTKKIAEAHDTFHIIQGLCQD